MLEITGKSVFGGVAIGPVKVYRKGENVVKRVKVEDTEAEVKRFDAAKDTAKDQLDALHDKALKEVGEANAAIFEAHRMFLEDPGYLDSVYNIIRTQGVNAEVAVATTGDNYAEMLAAMDDDYMKARSADVKDVSNRVISVLQGNTGDGQLGDVPVILLADDLAPSETVQLDKTKVLSFVTRHGSTNSHTAILARTMGIPAIIGADFSEDVDGRTGIVDGALGKLFIDPDEETLKKYTEQKAALDEKKRLLQELKGKDNVTIDGKKINLYANIGGVADVAEVLNNDAGGIGLFRSEFLYLKKDDYPTEEEQFEAYRKVAQMMAGKKVIIRTLDIGADKQADYFHLEHEENPAMGFRAIRICLKRPEIFKTQLRAIFRASYYGNIAIMYPNCGRCEERARCREHSLRGCGAGHHGGDPRGRHHERGTGAGSRFLFHRNERPDPVHPGLRPAERRGRGLC